MRVVSEYEARERKCSFGMARADAFCEGAHCMAWEDVPKYTVRRNGDPYLEPCAEPPAGNEWKLDRCRIV